MAGNHGPFQLLSDDLLASVLGKLNSSELRQVAPTCRRWAELLQTRLDLWTTVTLHLPHKKSRGRDRRNSYTTPCALSVPRIKAWLARRRAALAELRVDCLYPDALPLLGELVPEAVALRVLDVHGQSSQWPAVSVDWGWLAGMPQLRCLFLHDALPALPQLAGCLPRSLERLWVDRVSSYAYGLDEEDGSDGLGSWDELPASFAKLPQLSSLTLGSCCAVWAEDGQDAALAPLADCVALRELGLPHSTLAAVPALLTKLHALTSLSFAGSVFQAEEESSAFQPLAALTQLRDLDLARCALRQGVPAAAVGLTSLECLVLAGNDIHSLPEGAYLPRLTRLDLSHCPLPFLDGLPTSCSALRVLDLSGCRIAATSRDWAQRLQAWHGLELLRHSAAAAQALSLPGGAVEFVPCPSLHSSTSAPAGLGCELLEVLEAAATLVPPFSPPEFWHLTD